jgi:hypothetical protein
MMAIAPLGVMPYAAACGALYYGSSGTYLPVKE